MAFSADFSFPSGELALNYFTKATIAIIRPTKIARAAIISKPITKMGHMDACKPQLAIVCAIVAVTLPHKEPDLAFSEAACAQFAIVKATFVDKTLIALAFSSFAANCAPT